MSASDRIPPERVLLREIERLRTGIWLALEALGDGDTWHAADLLLALADGGPDLRDAA